MTVTTQHVYQGVWRDHSARSWNRYQWTLPEQAAVAMTNLIAVALALALSRIPMLLKPPVAWYRKKYSKQTSSTSPTAACGGVAGVPLAHIANSHTGNNHDENDESLIALDSVESGILNALKIMFRGHIRLGVVESGNAVTKLGRRAIINARDDTLKFSLALLFAICLVGIFVMEQTLAILSANIVTGSDVLSTHPNCGSWRLNYTAYTANGSYSGPPSWVQFSTLQAKELRARNYAEKCYGVRDEIEACDMFSTPTIHYEMNLSAACPFADGMCLMGLSSAVAMDTGYQPLSTLGFNLPISGSFRRRTVCAPLTTDNYVHIGHSNESPDSFFWAYLYGWPVEQQNHNRIPVLYNHTRRTIEMTAAGYHLIVKGENTGFMDVDNFIPIPELRTPDGSVVIFFLHSPGMCYDKPRTTDPMFPTNVNRTLQIANTSSILFVNLPTLSQPQAGVLACVDSHELCIDGSGCADLDKVVLPFSTEENPNRWQPLSSEIPHFSDATRFAFMAFFLSGSFWAYKHSAERGLDAFTQAWRGNYQFGLPADQWRIEVQKLFNVTLAQMQMNIWDVARGWKYDANLPYYDELWTKPYRGRDVCSTIKIHGYGWKNLSLAWFVTLLALSFCLVAGSFELDDTLVYVHVWRGAKWSGAFWLKNVISPGYQNMKSIEWRNKMELALARVKYVTITLWLGIADAYSIIFGSWDTMLWNMSGRRR